MPLVSKLVARSGEQPTGARLANLGVGADLVFAPCRSSRRRIVQFSLVSATVLNSHKLGK